MLRQTGRAGRPLEHFEVLRHSGLPRQPREYFAGPDAPKVVGRLAPLRRAPERPEAPEAWRQRITGQGLTDNGVWGGKVMWGHVADLVQRCRALPGLADADLRQALGALLGRPRLVFVTREDKVSQAVSLWRAIQTQAWRAAEPGAGAVHDPVYDYGAIVHLVSQLTAEESAWRAWFGQVEPPISVSYDELEDDPPAVAERVLRALGLGDVRVPSPPLSRQRDDLSAEWVRRFHRDREQAA
jgi:LPS sulfotransferase NodH